MSDEQEQGSNAVSADAFIAQHGGAFVIGMDTQRIWATGMQAFVNADFTMIVFREQTIYSNAVGEPGEPLVRNVASIVVPTPTFHEFLANSTAFAAQQSQG